MSGTLIMVIIDAFCLTTIVLTSQEEDMLRNFLKPISECQCLQDISSRTTIYGLMDIYEI